MRNRKAKHYNVWALSGSSGSWAFMFMDEAEYIGKKVKDLSEEYDRIKPEHKLQTFEDVERFWKDVIVPRINNFHCLKLDFSGEGEAIPENSVWYENWEKIDCY